MRSDSLNGANLMKRIQMLILLATLNVANWSLAADPAAGGAAKRETNSQPTVNPEASKEASAPATSEPGGKVAAPSQNTPSAIVSNGTNGLRLNFRGVPLEKVLDYLS